MVEFPKNEWDGNPQNPVNDGPPDPLKYQAADYNEMADEVIAMQQTLHDGGVMSIYNQTGGILAAGTYVRLGGLHVSGLPLAVKAIATSEVNLADAVVVDTIANNDSGNVSKFHRHGGLNTSGLGAPGTPLYLSDSVAGSVTTTKPAIVQRVGTVIKQDASAGEIVSNVVGGETAAVAAHALGGASHTADTLANLNSKITDATLDDSGDPRDPNTHALSHENGGGDEISVAGLSGVLADDQPAQAHDLGGAKHNADTLANLNSKITDATLDDVGDPRTPVSHAASHEEGGSDEINAGDLGSGAASAGRVLTADGAGGVQWNPPGAPGAHATTHHDGGTDEIEVEDLATGSVDTSTALRPNGAGGLSFSDVAHSQLTGVGADDHHARDHAATHVDGGSDEIDGDTVDIDFTPSKYTPDASAPEANDVDDLAAHLKGIDSELETGGRVVNTVQTLNAAQTTLATVSIPDDTAVLIQVWVSARRTDSPDRGAARREALVYREGGGGATLEGAVGTPFSRASDGSWDATIDVSGNDARVRVTGALGQTINWRSEHITIEVS